MDLNNFLSQLGAGKRDVVYLSVTPSVGLELIQLDEGNHTVKNYAYRPLPYNESLRQIADMEIFKNAVVELFEELRINIKSNIILNLPMVMFGSKELPLLLADDAVSEALTSEVEQSYIFKRYEPLISWCDASNSQSGEMRKLFYSAMQKNIIEDIKAGLTELGATLVGVEMSLTSILKAMAYSGLAEEQMKAGISWNLMLITQNGYSICSLVGKNIVDYYDEPLAIKSFEGEEIYNAINASAQITLMNYPANYLFVVSQTDMVSAELISSRLQVEGIVNYWENNSFKKQDLIPVSLEILEDNARKISLEAIGIASNAELPVKFNFMAASVTEDALENPDEPVHVVLGSTEFDISPNAARNIAILIAIIILIPIAVAFIVFPMIAKQKQARVDEVASKLQQVEAEIKRIQDEQSMANSFDVNGEIKKVMSNNRAKLMAYTALGESVPKKLWLTYFIANDDGKFDIKGESKDVEDIYLFYRNMKDSLISTNLRIHKLQMKSDSVDDAVTIDALGPTDYEFEITNMTDTEIKDLTSEDNNGEQPNNDQNNNG